MFSRWYDWCQEIGCSSYISSKALMSFSKRMRWLLMYPPGGSSRGSPVKYTDELSSLSASQLLQCTRGRRHTPSTHYLPYIAAKLVITAAVRQTRRKQSVSSNPKGTVGWSPKRIHRQPTQDAASLSMKKSVETEEYRTAAASCVSLHQSFVTLSINVYSK